MRNLKKILALVLALVMVVGMMTVASAATPGTGYTDDATINSKYDEAVQILTQLGVFRGDGDKFNPTATITRAEAAAIVYRIVTGDVNDVQVGIYADYNKFDDVPSTAWYAGYVNFCANGQYIQGDGAGRFYPMEKVNGYQLLAIIMRSIGYGQKGEFTGAGWEIRTATQAKALGITDKITEGTLGAATPREVVAELLYRGIAQTSMVDYTMIFGYEPAYVTLAYQQFGLQGEGTVTGNVIKGYEVEDYEVMTVREAAVADDKYGEPVAYWTADAAYVGTDKAIEIRFNPVATYTTALTDSVIYTSTSGAYTDSDFYYVDGKEGTKIAYVNGRTPVDTTGKGVVTDVFVADYQVFVTSKNTYADTVKQAYLANAVGKDIPLLLNADKIDYEGWEGALNTAAWDAITSTLAGIAKNSVVIYNMYKDVADFTTIHVPTMKNVTLTNSYDTDKVDDSYFKVGNAKYEYNDNYLNTKLEVEILDRNELLPAGEENQNIYFDDFGYVIYAVAPATQAQTGILLITNSTYGGGNLDNGYWNTFKGYDMTGKAVTVKGGIDRFFYGDKNEAQDYAVIDQIGLYEYVIGDEGRYKLTYIGETVTVDLGETGSILAGAPNSLELDSKAVMDSETVYVIANYSSRTGLITGYTVKTGIKDIPNMTDGKLTLNDGKDNTDIAFEAQYVENTDDGTVEFVFVTGAKQTKDTRGKTQAVDVFYLADIVPERQFAEYDLYNVVMGGKATTLKIAADAYTFTDPGFYYITEWADDYVAECEVVTDGSIDYLAADVLEYAADHDEDVEVVDNHNDGMIVLANNCKIYDVSNGTCEAITVDHFAYYTYEGVVAEYDGYGYATIIYLVPTGVVGG